MQGHRSTADSFTETTEFGQQGTAGLHYESSLNNNSGLPIENGLRSYNRHASEVTPPNRFSEETIRSWSGWFTGESSSIRNVGNQNHVHDERIGHGGYEPATSSSPLNLELSLGRGEASQGLNLNEGHASPGSSSAVPRLPCKRKAPVEIAEHLSLGSSNDNVRRARSDLPAHVPVIDLTASPDRPSNLVSGSTNSVTQAEPSLVVQTSAPPASVTDANVRHDGSESEDEGADISPLAQSGPTVVPQENASTQPAQRQGEPMTADADSVYSSEDEDEYMDLSALLQPDVSRDSSQAIAARSERRNRLLSEVRNVLAVLRTGGQLNLEELTLHPSWFGRLIAMHDAHQDMRVDVDNMSYEQLLALGERIGNVSTGLSDETVERYLKTVKFYTPRFGSTKADSCCICQDAFVKGVRIGRLDCGHDFHPDCIKQWLREKNVCPVCRKTALANAAST